MTKESDSIEDILYIELGNWFIGVDYPDSEPFRNWIRKNRFKDTDWVKENKLVVAVYHIEMEAEQYCITAPRSFVEQKCPDLLGRYSSFLRKSPFGKWNLPFENYDSDNIGVHHFLVSETGFEEAEEEDL